MKTVIAYSLVIIGIPHFVGATLSMIACIPLGWLATPFIKRRLPLEEALERGKKWGAKDCPKMSVAEMMPHIAYDLVHAIAMSIVAGLIFHWLNVPLSWAVLIIIGAWQGFSGMGMTPATRILALSGTVIGWFIVLPLLYLS
jgi:hypothetical protein